MARNTGQLRMKAEALKPVFLQFFLYLHQFGRFLQLAIFFFLLAFHGIMGNQCIIPLQPRNLPPCELSLAPFITSITAGDGCSLLPATTLLCQEKG